MVRTIHSVTSAALSSEFRVQMFNMLDLSGLFFLPKTTVEDKLRNLSKYMGYTDVIPQLEDYGRYIADILPDRFTPSQFITSSMIAAGILVRDLKVKESPLPKRKFDDDPQLGSFLKSAVPLIAEAIVLSDNLLEINPASLSRERLNSLDYQNEWVKRVERDFRNYKSYLTQEAS